MHFSCMGSIAARESSTVLKSPYKVATGTYFSLAPYFKILSELVQL